MVNKAQMDGCPAIELSDTSSRQGGCQGVQVAVLWGGGLCRGSLGAAGHVLAGRCYKMVASSMALTHLHNRGGKRTMNPGSNRRTNQTETVRQKGRQRAGQTDGWTRETCLDYVLSSAGADLCAEFWSSALKE